MTRRRGSGAEATVPGTAAHGKNNASWDADWSAWRQRIKALILI